MKNVLLPDGRSVKYGSKRHINELEHIILRLDHLRRKIIGRDNMLRKERYTISKAIESVRAIKRKVQKYNSSQTTITKLIKKHKLK